MDDFFNLFTQIDIPSDSLPFGIILTNAGAGSETSNTSVITHSKLNIKSIFT